MMFTKKRVPLFGRIFIGMMAIGLMVALGTSGMVFAEVKVKPQAGGALKIAMPYTVGTLDPLHFMADADFHVITQIYEPLVLFNEEGNPIPRLAASWQSPDPTTWVFYLRKGARWQTGNEVFPKGTKAEVTADDVVTTLNLVLNPDNKATFYSKLAKVIKSVEAVDKHTVKVVTQAPYAFLMEDLGHIPIVSKQAVEKVGAGQLGRYPIGSGPFKLSEARLDNQITLVRNDDYYLKPLLARVTFQVIPDKSVATMALESGDVDVVTQLPPLEIPRIAADKRFVVMAPASGSYRYIAFNQRKPPFDDLKIREAIAMGIDIRSALKAIFPAESLAQPAWGPVPPGIPGYDPSLQKIWTYDPERARELLAAQGWADTDKDGVLEKDGRKFSFVLQAPNDPNRSKLAVIVADQLKAIGLEAKVKIEEWGMHLQDLAAGQADMFVMGGGSTPDGLLYLFHSGLVSKDHNTGFRNAEVDQLLDKAKATTDAAARKKLWQEAQRLIVENRVHLPGYYEFVNAGVAKYVHDFKPANYTLLLVGPGRNVWVEKR